LERGKGANFSLAKEEIKRDRKWDNCKASEGGGGVEPFIRRGTGVRGNWRAPPVQSVLECESVKQHGSEWGKRAKERIGEGP